MARLFVHSDNLAARAEILPDREDDYAYACAGCRGTEEFPTDVGYRRLEDALQGAEIHLDHCKRCTDPNCLTTDRHDAGRRCRS